MPNFCNVLTTNPSEKAESNRLLSFQELFNNACRWIDEMEVLEDTFKRQAWKVIEGEVKVMQAKQFIASAAHKLNALKWIQDTVESELNICLFNLDVLELLLQSVEAREPELHPKFVDCQRYPIYQRLLELVCLIDLNKKNIEKFSEEYKESVQAYSKKYVITGILNHHVKILQNISSHLDDLENLQQTTEGKLNNQILCNLRMMNHFLNNFSFCLQV